MSNATNNIHVVQYEFAIVLKINPLKDCKFLNQTMCYNVSLLIIMLPCAITQYIRIKSCSWFSWNIMSYKRFSPMG